MFMTVPPPPPTVEIWWEMPNGGNASNVTWPQTYLADPSVLQCGVSHQVDTYLSTEAPIFTADNVLYLGEDYQSATQRGAISWRFVDGPACIPITADLTITADVPTCDVPFNTITYDIPAGLTLGGRTGQGTIHAEDFPPVVYGVQVVDVVTFDSKVYVWSGPSTLTYGPLQNPNELICPTPTPISSSTPTPSVTTPVAPQELAETGSTPSGGFFFAGGAFLFAIGLIFARKWWDKRGPGGTAVVTG